MKRLNEKNVNTPEISNKAFDTIWKGDMHYVDWSRFKLLVEYFNKGMQTYVDVGCFNSPMPMELKKAYPHVDVWGIDHADELIERLQKMFPEVNYVVGDCYKLPFEDDSVDYVVAGELIEHLEDPQKFVDEAYRVLKKNGVLAISTPFEELISEPDLGGDQHLWSFRTEDIADLLKGFADAEIATNHDTAKIFIAYGRK